MIKKLLIFILGTTALTVSAQLNNSGTGLILDHTSATSNCNLNSSSGSNGVMQYGNTFVEGSYLAETTGPLVLTSLNTVPSGGNPTWFPIPVIDGDCSNLWTTNAGIDMTSDSEVTITAKSSIAGATIQFFLGGSGSQWSALTSTYNTGNNNASVIAEYTFTAANTEETIIFDMATINANDWNAWTGKDEIQSTGYRSLTDAAVFSILRLEFGAESTGSTDTTTTTTDTTTTTNNGQACTSTTDDGLAQATFYNLIANGSSNTVRCSFDVQNSVKGTNYGALETATLHETPAKYCGMCVEMTGVKGTAIVQVVDECPDCWEHNSGDTDIDLSPTAFNAIVGEEGIGRSDITWNEVSCPWATPIKLTFESAHEWNVKVIIENHVNRIAKVEITFGGQWVDMIRGADNGWVKGNINGETKSIRITDIYGSEITMEDLDFSQTLSWETVDGTEQFPACGLSTSTADVNTLDFVSVYPNPASSTLTFVGLEDVETIQIVSTNGQVVASQYLGGNVETADLDISNLATGVYVAKMNGVNTSGTVTFVKK